MKNIHVLPTDKPSRLFEIIQFNLSFDKTNYFSEEYKKLHKYKNQNIYITNDEEIKEGDWIFDLDINRIVKADNLKVITSKKSQCWYYKKIILTTDQDLIKDGVQAIDNEFLEWFVKNPSCEYIKTEKWLDDEGEVLYSRIIPKEEPKQELDCPFDFTSRCTMDRCDCKPKQQCKDCNDSLADCTCIEDTIDMKQENTSDYIDRHIVQAMVEVAKQKMYSEEEVIDIAKQAFVLGKDFGLIGTFSEWFEQFRKK